MVDGDTHLLRFVDEVVGDAGPWECDEADWQ